MFQLLLSATTSGWGAAIAMMAASATLIMWIKYVRQNQQKNDLRQAEQSYLKAVASRDPDRIRLAAKRLQAARKKAGAS